MWWDFERKGGPREMMQRSLQAFPANGQDHRQDRSFYRENLVLLYEPCTVE